jgi:hypothetical protein
MGGGDRSGGLRFVSSADTARRAVDAIEEILDVRAVGVAAQTASAHTQFRRVSALSR